VKKISICFLTVICALGFFNTPAFAWEGKSWNDKVAYVDVHFSDTKAWCVEQGFSSANANIVANWDSAVDIDYMNDATWHLNRVNYVTANKTRDYDTRLYWFDQKMKNAKVYLQQAGELLKQYNKTKDKNLKEELQNEVNADKVLALEELGYALHPLQDRWAHLDAGINTPTKKVGTTHGMLNASSVKVLMPNGTYKSMQVETVNYVGGKYLPTNNLYDDINYDFINGQWVFLNNDKLSVTQIKQKNSRWINTKQDTVWALNDFLKCAKSYGIDFSK
jgi:hypothetical protein